jgi:glutathione S-transferase
MVVARTCTGLRPRSEAYFRATREPRFPGGVALETLAPVGSAQRAEHFAKFQAALGQLAVHIARGAPAGPAAGPFVMGREPGYADALLGARLLWAKRVLEDGEWQEVMGWHEGRWKRLMDALEEFAGVDEGEEWVSPSGAAPA